MLFPSTFWEIFWASLLIIFTFVIVRLIHTYIAHEQISLKRKRLALEQEQWKFDNERSAWCDAKIRGDSYTRR